MVGPSTSQHKANNVGVFRNLLRYFKTTWYVSTKVIGINVFIRVQYITFSGPVMVHGY